MFSSLAILGRPSRTDDVIPPQIRLSGAAAAKLRSGGEYRDTAARVRLASGWPCSTRTYGTAMVTETTATTATPPIVDSATRRAGRGRPCRSQRIAATKPTTSRR